MVLIQKVEEAIVVDDSDAMPALLRVTVSIFFSDACWSVGVYGHHIFQVTLGAVEIRTPWLI